LQKEIGTLLQDCGDARDELRPDELAADCVNAAAPSEPSLVAAFAQNDFEMHQASAVSTLVQPDVLEEGWGETRRHDASAS
jgi:hypothetical protein